MKLYNSKIFFSILIFIFGVSGLSGGVILRRFVELSNQKKNLIQISNNESKMVHQPIQFSSFIDGQLLKAGFDYEKESFLKFQEEYITQRLSFIEVDLRKMILKLYQEGTIVKEILVLTKGREGSWWETPSGNYEVLTKKINHFSSIGNVWMPYSIQFYGNFFIHGWPYYPDGTPVATTYSGGCVRLSTEDAKTVFQFAGAGTPVLILDEPDFFEPSDSLLVQKASQNLTGPAISAKAVLITDLDSGLVLLEKSSAEPLPMASLVKLMTGVVASELIYLEKTVKAGPLAFLGSGSIRDIFSWKVFPSFTAALSLVAGKNYTAFDLLYPLLMQSSNEAASLLVSFLGENEFVKQMNNKARSLGMTQTVFVDASGKNSGNIASVKDLAKLAKYILEKRQFLYDISRGKNYLTFGPLNFGNLDNYNEFVDNPNLIGVKNGQTSVAKETLITIWNLHLKETDINKKIAIIVLGSENRKTDTETLLSWLKDNFGLQ